MIPMLGVPTYQRHDLLQRMLDSIDYPVARLVIIANEHPLPPLRLPEMVQDSRVIHQPNAGVAGSWNQILKLPAPWWMIVNDDIRFLPGALAQMAERIAEDDTGVVLGHGWSWFAIKPETVFQAGLFDENFYPAYLEDCDYEWRLKCLGITWVNLPEWLVEHGIAGQGSCTIRAAPALEQENQRTHGLGFAYYRSKWGGINGQEIFVRPFDRWPIWAWQYDPVRRAILQWRTK